MSTWKSARALFLFTFLTFALIPAARAALEDYTWFLSGNLSIGADNEILIAVTNDSAFSSASIEVHYDSMLLAAKEPVEQNAQLLGRASDLTLLPSKLADWDYVRLTFFSTSAEEPYPDVEVGSGDIAKVVLSVKDGVAPGTMTTLELTTKSAKISLVKLQLEIQGEQGNVAPGWEAKKLTLNLTEGTPFTHVFDAPVDLNSQDIVTVSAANFPGDAGFDPLTRTFNWTPGFEDAGTHEFVITATDQDGAKGYLTVSLVVENVNRAPKLILEDSYEFDLYSHNHFNIKAEDPDGQSVTVTGTDLPTGISINYPVVYIAVSEAGVYTVTLTAEDPEGLTDVRTVTVTVTKTNYSPRIDHIDDITVEAGNVVNFTVTVQDPLEDPLPTPYIVITDETDNILTRGATFSGNVFNWTPAAADIGPNVVTFKVIDSGGLTHEIKVTITVTVADRNVNAPVAFADFGEIVIEEEAEYSLQLPLADPGLEGLNYWAIDLPEGSNLDTETGLFTWTPTLLQSGTYTVTFGVSDGSFQDEEEVVVTVTEKDVLPVLQSVGGLPVGDLTVNEGALLAVALEAEDASGEQINFSAAGLPAGAQLFPLGLLYYKPGYDEADSYPVTFTATDASGNTDQVTVNLIVVDVNRKPVLAALDNQAVQENQRLTFTVTAEDPDGDEFTLGSGALPTGAAFTAATGVFDWTPDQAQSGNYEVLFTANDHGTGGLDSLELIISVGNVNRPPGIDPVGNRVVDEGATLSFQVTASDPDVGDAVTISATGLPGTPQISQIGTNPTTATITLTPGYLDQGTYNVVVTATDNAAQPLSSPAKLTLEVFNIDVAPEFTGALPGTLPYEVSVREGERLEIAVTAVDPGGDKLILSAVGLPRNARLDLSGGVSNAKLVFTPDFTQAGLHQFDILVTDGGDVVTKQIEVTVEDVNRPPRVPPIVDQAVAEGDIITFAVEASDPDGDSLTVFTSGRVSFLTEGDPPPARIRDGNVFVFDTDLLPEDEQIKSAFFLFWAEDERGAVSETVWVEIAVIRSECLDLSSLASVNLAQTGSGLSPGTGIGVGAGMVVGSIGAVCGSGLAGGIINNINNSLAGANCGGGSLAGLLASAGDGGKSKDGVFTFLAGDLESQFYGIRRGWGVDLTAFAAAEGADSLATGEYVTVTLSYFDEDLPTEIPNFTEARLGVFGYDAVAGNWIPADSVTVDTVANEATFSVTNPQIVIYTIGAVLDVVAPLITDLEVRAGSFTVNSTGVDTLYDLGGTYEFRVNITDDEIVSPTDAKLFYALGAGGFTETALSRSGPNLFTATIEQGTLPGGTVVSYYVLAMDEMNSVTLPEGAPDSFYELVLMEYTGQPGDVNGDTKVDIFDLLELLKVLSKNAPESIFSDVDVSGKTDIFDLLELLKILAG